MAFDQRERFSDSEEATRHALEAWQTGIFTALPVIIKKHDTDKNTAHVQPVTKLRHVNAQGKATWKEFPILEDVPVNYHGGGGVTIVPRLKDGDEGLLILCSRDFDKWWQQGGVQEQTHTRMHDISNGWLIPGGRSQPRKLKNISSDEWQLRDDDGKNFVGFNPETKQFRVVCPDKAARIEGDLYVTGTIKSEGEITAKVNSTNVSLTTHTTTEVTTGTDLSGPPETGT